jgi:Na+-driven multidrug efflux pump
MQMKTDMQVNDLDETAREARYQMMGTQAIAPLIFRLALPSIVSMLITSLYNMADTFFVSQLGTSAAGAVGVIFPLMALIQAYGMTFGVGGGSYISRLLGQKDRKRATRPPLRQYSRWFVMSVITASGLLFLKPLFICSAPRRRYTLMPQLLRHHFIRRAADCNSSCSQAHAGGGNPFWLW